MSQEIGEAGERLKFLQNRAHDPAFKKRVLGMIKERVQDLPGPHPDWELVELRLQGMLRNMLWAVWIAEVAVLAISRSVESEDLVPKKTLSQAERRAAVACALSLPEIRERFKSGAVPEGYVKIAVETVRQCTTPLGATYF